MSDFYSAGALGQIAGQLDALSTSMWVDRLFDRLESQRDVRQGLEQIRAEWAAAYEQLRQIALNLEAKNARLEADVAQKQAEMSRRDLEIVKLERQVFDRDGKIHDLDDKVFYLEQDKRRLSAAANDYRARLAIISDEHDAAFI